MAVGAVGKPNISFEDWLKAENKEGQVKKAPQMKAGTLTDNGVPVHLAQELHSGKTIFQVAAQNPTKETAGANGASSSGVGTQPLGMNDGGSRAVDNVVTNDNNNTVLAAGATGHTAQSQAPTLASGLTASQGNENTGSQDGATGDSKQLNLSLYAQYEAAMKEAQVADSGGEVSTGEGTLSTGSADGVDSSGGVNGTDGTQGADASGGVDGGVSTSPTDATNPNDPANSPPDSSGNENPNDPANDNPNNINKQEQKQQEEILDTRRFKKFEEQAA